MLYINLKIILVPKYSSLKWNEIPKNLPSNQWKIINDPASINACLIEWNLAHINQAQSTPCTIDSLSSFLQGNNFTKIGEEILQGKEKLSNKSLSPLIIFYFK